jgi:predicted GIY-YIG superfamily endonuclease
MSNINIANERLLSIAQLLKRKPKDWESVWGVYLLQRVDGKKTYIGYTNDIKTRLRQHNGEIKGGAKSTSSAEYKLICIVWPFPNKIVAMRFERAWKGRFVWQHKSSFSKFKKTAPRKRIKYGVMGRYEKLEQLLCTRTWSSKCDPTENLAGLQVSWTLKEDPRPDLASKWSFSLSAYQKQYRCAVTHTFGHDNAIKIFDLMYHPSVK